MKKIITLSLLFVTLNAFSIPQQPTNGGTGKANDNASTIAINGPYPIQFNLSGAAYPNLFADHKVYVDCLSGSNVTGDGSVLSKFASTSAAEASITTASPTSPYEIEINPGVCNETNLILKPNIFINGNNAILNISGLLSLDSSWGSGNNSFFARQLQLNPSNDTVFDFTGFGSHSAYIEMDNVRVLQNWNFSILGTAQEIVVLDGIFATNPQIDLTLQDVYGGLQNAEPYNFSVVNTGNYAGTVMTLSDDEILGDTLIQAQGAQNQIVNLAGNSLTIFGGTLTLDGANIIAAFDPSSFSAVPTLLNGATYILKSPATGMTVNYSPSAYTPDVSNEPGNATNPSVDAHLRGINNALVALDPGTPIGQQLFVNGANGNDSNSGTLPNHSLATYDNGAVPICEANANASNPYNVYVIGGASLPANFTIVPYCNVYIVGGALNAAGEGVLDSLWAAANSATTIINGPVNIVQGINLNFSAGDGNSIIFNIDPQNTYYFAITSPNTNPIGNVATVNLNPSTNEYFGGIFNGGVAVTDAGLIMQGGNVNGLTVLASTGSPFAYAIFQNMQLLGATTETGEFYVQSTNSIINSLNIDGPDGIYNTDASSYPGSLTFSGGAAISQVQTLSNSNGVGLSPTFAPANFSLQSGNWPSNSITAAFAGIDVALGAIQPELSGSFTPTVSCVSGCSSPTAVTGFYSSTGSASGDVETVTISATFTTSTLSGIFRASCPINPNFNASDQAGGVATLNRTSSAAIGDGSVVSINSVATNGVNFGWVTAIPTTNYTINATYQCYIH